MTPTREKHGIGPQLDSGVGSPPAPRPNPWLPLVLPGALDTGAASPSPRDDVFDGDGSSNAGAGGFAIPPRW